MSNYMFGIITSTYVYAMAWAIDDTMFGRLADNFQSALPF